MITRLSLVLPLPLALALALTACGDKSGPAPAGPTPDAKAASAKVLLAADPGEGVSVLDAKGMQAGDEVVVFGRIADMRTPYVAFRLTDEDLDYCGRGKDCESKCKEPWDYCCIQPETVAAASMPVEVHDVAGNPVSRKGVDLRLLDLVAMKGTLQKTESGGLMLVVTQGVYRRERPTLPDYVLFPE